MPIILTVEETRWRRSWTYAHCALEDAMGHDIVHFESDPGRRLVDGERLQARTESGDLIDAVFLQGTETMSLYVVPEEIELGREYIEKYG